MCVLRKHSDSSKFAGIFFCTYRDIVAGLYRKRKSVCTSMTRDTDRFFWEIRKVFSPLEIRFFHILILRAEEEDLQE